MSRRSKAGILAVLVVAAVGALLWWVASRPSDEAVHVPRGEPVARASAIALAPTDPDVPLAWMLEPGVPPRRVAGIVRRDGVPVADATVRLGSVRMSMASLPQPEVRTDADGAFDFGERPVGWYRVLAFVAPDGYAREVVDLRQTGRAPPPDKLVLEVEGCQRWTWGRVVDAGGGPVQGARVSRITRIPGGAWSLDHFVTSDEEGSFRLCGGSQYEVTVAADGYGTIRLPRGEPPDGHLVMLVPEAQLAGVVVDEQGAAIADAVLSLHEKGTKYRTQMGHHAISDADGRFRFRGVEPGRYQVTGEAGGHLTLAAEHEYFVDVGDVREDAVVVMRKCPRTLAGHVLHGSEPVAGASLSFGGMGVGGYTQEDGSFVLRCDDGTGFELEVAGYDVVEPTGIPDGDEDLLDLVVRVESRAEIRGRVTADGAPVSGAVVAIGDPESDSSRGIFGEHLRADTSDLGEYVLAGVPAGTHTLRAYDPKTGWGSAPRDVEVTDRATVAGVDLALQTVADITGVVRDEGGAAVADVTVRAAERGSISGRVEYTDGAPAAYAHVNQWETEATTDLVGRFTLRDVQRGKHEIRVTATDGAVWNGTASAGDDDLVIVLKRSGRIVGTVGGAGPRWYVQTQYKESVGKWSAEVRDGRFEIQAIPPGDYLLQLFPPPTGYGGPRGSTRTAEAEARVTVAAGQTAAVHLVAESDRGGSGTIVGRALYYPSGAVANGLRCSAGGRTAAVDDTGRFEIADVTSGKLVVDCRSSSTSLAGPMSTGERRASVADGARVEVTVHVVRVEDISRAGDIGARLTRVPNAEPAAVAFTAIQPGGAAAAAGLGEGDVLVAVEGAPATGEHASAARAYAHLQAAGTAMNLEVRKAGDDALVAIVLTPR